MNLERFLLENSKYEKVVYKALPTILYHCYNNEMLSESYLNDYCAHQPSDNLRKKFKGHFLYNKKRKDNFRKNCKAFRNWFRKSEFAKEEAEIVETAE